jgi:hypothetical protein
MSKSPTECKCLSCECGTYTYNESQVCASCEDNKHASGQKRWSTIVLANAPSAIITEEAM